MIFSNYFSLILNFESLNIFVDKLSNLFDSSIIISAYSFLSASGKFSSSNNFANPCIELIGVFISCDTLFIKSFELLLPFPTHLPFD